MEKVQKFTKSITPKGTPDQYGNQAYVIEFTDNTSGFFRCQKQDLFNVGVESTFYFGEEISSKGNKYWKIERVEKHEKNFEDSKKNSHGGHGSMKSSEQIEQINRSVAVKSVCELRSNTNVSIDVIINEAEILYDYIRLGIVDGNEEIIEKETDESPF